MGLFSAGFPTAVQGRLPHLTERTSFPLPSSGQATRPPGGSTAHLQLLENSTSYSLFATRGRLSRNRQLRLVENSNQHARMQANNLWESRAFCGKTVLAPAPPPLHCFAITPRSVKPLTKNCIARATSSKPIIRTRMRMPVSPRNARTRPAPASTQ